MAPARRGTELDKPDHRAKGKLLPPSVPGRNPKSSENRIAGTSTATPRPTLRHRGRKVDVASQPKTLPAGASRRLRLLVPAYIYPMTVGRWQRLFDAASKVEIVAIVNPNSGPGDERNSIMPRFSPRPRRGITLVGYVSTDYGKRPQAEIKKDIDTWVRLYPQIRGSSSTSSLAKVDTRHSSPSSATMQSGNSKIRR